LVDDGVYEPFSLDTGFVAQAFHVGKEVAMNSLEEAMSRLGKRFEGRARVTSWTRNNGPLRRAQSPASSFDTSPEPFGPSGVMGSTGAETVYPALFNTDTAKRRSYLKGVPILVEGIGRIIYRGQELRADDRAVWRQLVERARRQPGHPWLDFSARSILKAMGWGGSACDRARLRDCLERMQATVLRIPGATPETTVQVSLIDKCEWLPSRSGKTGRWRVWIEPQLRDWYESPSSAGPGTDKRVEALAERLRRLFAPFDKPYPRKVDTLWRQCGADVRVKSEFRRYLEGALKKLEARGFLESYEIDGNDLVRVVRALESNAAG
jgi:hypothetical protein